MNMMYSHTITVFNQRYKRAKVIDDSVDLSKFGYQAVRAEGPGRTGGGRARPQDQAHVRLQLLDVRTRLRQPRLRPVHWPPTGSTAASSTRSTPGRCARPMPSRSARCPSTSRSRPTAATCWWATGAPGTSASWTCEGQGDPAHPGRCRHRAASPSAPTARPPTSRWWARTSILVIDMKTFTRQAGDQRHRRAPPPPRDEPGWPLPLHHRRRARTSTNRVDGRILKYDTRKGRSWPGAGS